MSLTTEERIRNFRDERLGKIRKGDTPVKLEEAPKIILHIIPPSGVNPTARFDISSLADKCRQFKLMYTDVLDCWFNFDGFLISGPCRELDIAKSYLQIFRNGSIEAVDAFILGLRKNISSSSFEKGLLDALPQYVSIQKKLSVEPPLYIMLSLLGVRGYTMAHGLDDYGRRKQAHHPIDRDDLLLPEVVVEKFDCDLVKIMKLVFDPVWNACGYASSMNYDQSENRIKQQ